MSSVTQLPGCYGRRLGPALRLPAGAAPSRGSVCAALLLALALGGCSGEAPLAPFPLSRADANVAKADGSPRKGSTSSAAKAGAASTPSVPAPAPPPPEAPAPPPKPDWQLLLEDGIESYENGAYGNAIRKLGDAADDPRADKASHVKALKYLAFSYCVSTDAGPGRKPGSHLTLCRQAFERALAIDPTFELAQAERGHPVWGKQFQAARSAQSKKTSPGNASGPGANTPQSTSDAAKKRASASASGISAETGKQ